MGNGVFILSRSAALVEQLRLQLSPSYEVVTAESVDDAPVQTAHIALKAVIAHLAKETLNGHSPGEFLGTLQESARAAPILAVVDKDCPSRLSSLARQVASRCLDGDVDAHAIAELVSQYPSPPEDLIFCLPELPYKAIHGATRSLVTLTPAMFPMLDELRVAAAHDVTILLIGETGAGKTHLARLIHELSPRAAERFCTIACGTLPPDLIESELFGYVRGAFTGADRDKEGKFAAASDGTLLLDEIDVLSLDQQAKLLRVIETGEYEPVGSNETHVSRAGLIVASNFDLEQLVHAGTFRTDLYYRLNVLRFRLPPLRERPLDIEFLARKFARDHSERHGIHIDALAPEFLAALRGAPWPGNIRELENVMRRAVLYCRTGTLSVADLPSSLRHAPGVAEPSQPRAESLEARVGIIERQIIEESLERHHQHRAATARALGISRVTLYNKMKKLGMLQ